MKEYLVFATEADRRRAKPFGDFSESQIIELAKTGKIGPDFVLVRFRLFGETILRAKDLPGFPEDAHWSPAQQHPAEREPHQRLPADLALRSAQSATLSNADPQPRPCLSRDQLASRIGICGGALAVLVASVFSGGHDPYVVRVFQNWVHLISGTFVVGLISRFVLSFIPFRSDPAQVTLNKAARRVRKKWVLVASCSGLCTVAGVVGLILAVNASNILTSSVNGVVACGAGFVACAALYKAFGRS